MLQQLLALALSYLKLLRKLVWLPLLQRLRLHQRKAEVESSAAPISRKDSLQRLHRQSRQRVDKYVRFGALEVRTYESILGDNPSCSTGPPLAIGSSVVSRATTTVDRFEDDMCRGNVRRPRELDLLIGRGERETTLLNLGYTRAEIAAATRQTLRDKRRRRATADNLGCAFVEERVEGMRKSIQRKLKKKTTSKELYWEWKRAEASFVGARKEKQAAFRSGRAQSCLVLGRNDSESTVTPDDMSDTDCELQRRSRLVGRLPAYRRRASM